MTIKLIKCNKVNDLIWITNSINSILIIKYLPGLI